MGVGFSCQPLALDCETKLIGPGQAAVSLGEGETRTRQVSWSAPESALCKTWMSWDNLETVGWTRLHHPWGKDGRVFP